MYTSFRVSKIFISQGQEKLSENYLVRDAQCFGQRMLFVGGAIHNANKS